MSTASPAPSLLGLKSQMMTLFPAMKAKDIGIMADARHIAGGTSDHIGGNAIDIPAKLTKALMKALALLILRDPRVHYVIWDRVFYHEGKNPTAYTGSNPHTAHIHVSIYPAKRADCRVWTLVAPEARAKPLLTVTATGLNVRKGPGKNHAVLVVIGKGGHLRQTGPLRGAWAPVITTVGRTYRGWVHSGYVTGESMSKAVR